MLVGGGNDKVGKKRGDGNPDLGSQGLYLVATGELVLCIALIHYFVNDGSNTNKLIVIDLEYTIVGRNGCCGGHWWSGGVGGCGYSGGRE